MKNELDIFSNIRKLKILKNLISLIISLIISKLSSDLLDIILKIEQKRLIEIIIFITSILTINVLLEHYLNYLLFNKELKTNNKLKVIIYNKLYNLPVNEVEALGDGEIKELINDDLSVIESYFKSSKPNIINGIISTLGIGIYIFLYNSIGLYILITISFLQLIPTFIIKKYLIVNYNELRNIEAEITESYIDLYKGLDVIKNHNLYNWFNKIILDKHNKCIKIGIKGEAIGKVEQSLNELASILVNILTYIVVGIFIYIQKVDFGIGIQIIVLSSSFYNSINSIFEGLRNRIVFLNAYERINKKLYENKELETKNQNIDNTMPQCIKLQNVSFGYNDLILEDINIDIFDNEKVIILGKNGQGKTTLFKLMLRLYKQNKGVIKYKYDSSKIAWLPQLDYNFNISANELIQKMSNQGLLNMNDTMDMINKFKVKKKV